LHEMVTAVKRDGKVGLAYMKSFEIEERIREEGIAEGITQGKINDILDLLNDLGEIPPVLKERIPSQRDAATLRTWLKLAAKAESVAEFTKQI
ncbi:MAG: hypothetical protein K2K87_13820, partial [Lachnospiraceae bacterium]|nr:hypothetical protein [Lachnospiraceae bacterium]